MIAKVLFISTVIFLTVAREGSALTDIKNFQIQCDSGDMGGCFLLAERLDRGQGIPQNLAQAITLYKKACEGGRSIGPCRRLAEIYSTEPKYKNDVLYIHFLEKHCEMTSGKECVPLGVRYTDGTGVSRDDTKALKLLASACGSTLPTPTGCDRLTVLAKKACSVDDKSVNCSTILSSSPKSHPFSEFSDIFIEIRSCGEVADWYYTFLEALRKSGVQLNSKKTAVLILRSLEAVVIKSGAPTYGDCHGILGSAVDVHELIRLSQDSAEAGQIFLRLLDLIRSDFLLSGFWNFSYAEALGFQNNEGRKYLRKAKISFEGYYAEHNVSMVSDYERTLELLGESKPTIEWVTLLTSGQGDECGLSDCSENWFIRKDRSTPALRSDLTRILEVLLIGANPMKKKKIVSGVLSEPEFRKKCTSELIKMLEAVAVHSDKSGQETFRAINELARVFKIHQKSASDPIQ